MSVDSLEPAVADYPAQVPAVGNRRARSALRQVVTDSAERAAGSAEAPVEAVSAA